MEMLALMDRVPLDGEFTFRGFVPPIVVGAILLVAVVLAGLAYQREAGRVAAWKRILLATVRMALLASLAFLMLKPTLVREVRGEKSRPVEVLIDTSLSMATADPRPVTLDQWRAALAFNLVSPDSNPPETGSDLPGDRPEAPTRLEVVRAVLANPRLALLDGLAGTHPVRLARFGTGREIIDSTDPNWVASLVPVAPRTALFSTVSELLNRDAAELPAAIVVFTDGRDNASRARLPEVAAAYAEAGVPVHVYVVGGSALGQVELLEAGVPETLYVDDTAVVPIRFRGRGFTEAKAELTLKLGGVVVASKLVAVAEDGTDQREVLTFAPGQGDVRPGKQDLTVTVRIVTEAVQPADEVVKPVRVVDRKLKVLVAETQPRWEFKFLQRALLRDRRVEARFWLAEADQVVLAGGPPFVPTFPTEREELAGYDLLILGDLTPRSLTPSQMNAIQEFVAEGGGLIHIAGRQAGTAAWVNTPLAEVLPVDLTTDSIGGGPRDESFRPEPTPTGARAGVLQLADDPAESAQIWAELPGVYGFVASARLKPAAEAFLQHPTLKTLEGRPAPVLAGHYYGKGYVLFSAVDETWRWRYNAADKYFGRYWSQLVYLAGAPRSLGTRLTQLAIDNPDPVLGSAAQVYARLLKPDLSPQLADSVEAIIEKLDAEPGANRTQRITLRRMPDQPGEYTAAIPFNEIGKFALTVDNSGNAAAAEYRVTLPPDHEQSPGGPAEEALRTLAETSGGKLYREEDLHNLARNVQPQSTPTQARLETVLWNRWAFLVVLVLLSVEWVGRRMVSLS